MRRAYAGDRRDQVGTNGGNIAHGWPTVAVADQIHFRFATDRNDFLDLLKKFLSTQLRGVELADFGNVNLCAITSKRLGNAVPVVDAKHAVEAEHAMCQHDRVTRLGVAAGAE